MSERLDDGYSTTMTFPSPYAGVMGVTLWEKSITPPGIEGGGANDTTTMRNSAWRTRAPKHLKTMSEISGTCAYDPAVYDDIILMCQENLLVTVNFPDGSSLQIWGWLDEFKPGEATEGEQPTATFTFICSNQNGSGVETAPVYVAA